MPRDCIDKLVALKTHSILSADQNALGRRLCTGTLPKTKLINDFVEFDQGIKMTRVRNISGLFLNDYREGWD